MDSLKEASVAVTEDEWDQSLEQRLQDKTLGKLNVVRSQWIWDSINRNHIQSTTEYFVKRPRK